MHTPPPLDFAAAPCDFLVDGQRAGTLYSYRTSMRRPGDVYGRRTEMQTLYMHQADVRVPRSFPPMRILSTPRRYSNEEFGAGERGELPLAMTSVSAWVYCEDSFFAREVMRNLEVRRALDRVEEHPFQVELHGDGTLQVTSGPDVDHDLTFVNIEVLTGALFRHLHGIDPAETAQARALNGLPTLAGDPMSFITTAAEQLTERAGWAEATWESSGTDAVVHLRLTEDRLDVRGRLVLRPSVKAGERDQRVDLSFDGSTGAPVLGESVLLRTQAGLFGLVMRPFEHVVDVPELDDAYIITGDPRSALRWLPPHTNKLVTIGHHPQTRVTVHGSRLEVLLAGVAQPSQVLTARTNAILLLWRELVRVRAGLDHGDEPRLA